MASVNGLKKIIGKKAKIDWRKVSEGERLRKRLIAQGFQGRSSQTLSPGYGRRARILDDTEHDSRVVKVQRNY
jgi:hypothetical protein